MNVSNLLREEMDTEIAQQFNELGLEPSAEVIAKSTELCIQHQIEAVEFVEQWIAFSISNLNAAEPTVDYLTEFERKFIQSKLEKNVAARSSKKTVLPVPVTTHDMEMVAGPLAIYGIVTDHANEFMHKDDAVGSIEANTTWEDEIVVHTPKSLFLLVLGQ